jgi:HemK-related putative methylase
MTKLYYNNYVLDISKTIYYPSEDTYLLLDSIKEDLLIIKKDCVAMEVGCGNSILSLYLYDFVNDLYSVDVNSDVIDYLKNIKKEYSLDKLKILKSDLFKNIPKDLLFDVIVFNPPYVCSKSLDLLNLEKEDLCTLGGINGSEIIFKFLKSLPNYLNKNGICYLLVSSQNDLKNIYKSIIMLNFKYSIINSKKLFFEELFVIKIIFN